MGAVAIYPCRQGSLSLSLALALFDLAAVSSAVSRFDQASKQTPGFPVGGGLRHLSKLSHLGSYPTLLAPGQSSPLLLRLFFHLFLFFSLHPITTPVHPSIRSLSTLRLFIIFLFLYTPFCL